MNWQNQFAQYTSTQTPAQNTLPYSGYSDATTYVKQAPSGPHFQAYTGLAGQSVASNAAQQPELVLQATQIPPEVIAAAQAAGLGTPTREYRKRASDNGGILLGGIQSIMRMTFLGVGITILIICGVMLFTVPAPYNLISTGITLVSILPFLPMMLKFSRKIGGGGGKQGLVAWECPEGLVYTQDKQLHTVRWNQVRHVWRKLGMLNGMMATLAYTVEPTNEAPFSFSLLNGPFADHVLSQNGGGSLSISFGGGQISNNGGYVQIMGNYSLTEYAGLGDLIEEQTTQRILPQLLETYQAGNPIQFGTFSLRQQGMSDGARELNWHEVDQVQISNAAIQITKKPASITCFNLSAAVLPDFALLCALLNTLRGK